MTLYWPILGRPCDIWWHWPPSLSPSMSFIFSLSTSKCREDERWNASWLPFGLFETVNGKIWSTYVYDPGILESSLNGDFLFSFKCDNPRKFSHLVTVYGQIRPFIFLTWQPWKAFKWGFCFHSNEQIPENDRPRCEVII